MVLDALPASCLTVLRLLLTALMCPGLLTAQAQSDHGERVVYIGYSQTAGETSLLIRSDKPIESYQDFQLLSPPRIVIDIFNARFPQSISTEINHAAVLKIRASSNSSKARIVLDIAQTGEVRYNIHPVKTGLLTKIWMPESESPVTEIPLPSPSEHSGQHSSEKNLSVEFSEAEIKDFFAVVAEQTGIIVKLAPDVAGSVTLRLIDMPVQQALDLVCEIYHLEIVQMHDHWLVRSVR